MQRLGQNISRFDREKFEIPLIGSTEWFESTAQDSFETKVTEFAILLLKVRLNSSLFVCVRTCSRACVRVFLQSTENSSFKFKFHNR